MTLGNKIKLRRMEKKMTQAQLCDGKITRNLLSEIECDKASPSIGTLKFLAMRLELPISYLLSEEDDPFYYVKKEKINDVKSLFESKKYKKCIDLINSFETTDDELNYIMVYCHFELGREAILHGSLHTGLNNLEKAAEYTSKTIYDTSRIKNLALLYTSLARNIQSPLLEFDSESFKSNLDNSNDFDFYKYLIQDYEYNYRNPIFSKHIEAKELIKVRKYQQALNILREIEDESKTDYNAHVVFSVYCDLENCYKQIMDFENTYKYASKRLSLIEAFKS